MKSKGSYLQVFTGLPILVYVIKVLKYCLIIVGENFLMFVLEKRI